MKHVGLNVAADPFINSALKPLRGGLVVVVADDPSMHSSQDEQDSRYYADFARIPCFEPADHQQVYEMTREAFDLSERFHIPVLLRIVTNLCHNRAAIRVAPASASHTASVAGDYTVAGRSAANAGVVLAESLADGEVRPPWTSRRFSTMRRMRTGSRLSGRRIGLCSYWGSGTGISNRKRITRAEG